jgi:hypothetical protein
MNIDQRLQDLAGKTNSRLTELRTRVEAVEQRPIGARITVGTVAPSTPSVNDLWVDTNP